MSVSANPDRSVLYHVVHVVNYEFLKHVVNVLIRDDRHRCILSQTKPFGFMPVQHRTTGIETVVLTIHRVAFGRLKSSGYRRF